MARKGTLHIYSHACFTRSLATFAASSTIVRFSSPGLDLRLCGAVASQLRIMSPCILLAVGRSFEHPYGHSVSYTFKHSFERFRTRVSNTHFHAIQVQQDFFSVQIHYDDVIFQRSCTQSAFVRAQFSIATLSRGGEWRADGPVDNYEKACCACIFTGHLQSGGG